MPSQFRYMNNLCPGSVTHRICTQLDSIVTSKTIYFFFVIDNGNEKLERFAISYDIDF